MEQYLKRYREAICSQSPTQFVVTRAHNILKVTDPWESGHVYYKYASCFKYIVAFVHNNSLDEATCISKYWAELLDKNKALLQLC